VLGALGLLLLPLLLPVPRSKGMGRVLVLLLWVEDTSEAAGMWMLLGPASCVASCTKPRMLLFGVAGGVKVCEEVLTAEPPPPADAGGAAGTASVGAAPAAAVGTAAAVAAASLDVLAAL
jgi:hypothetical protein